MIEFGVIGQYPGAGDAASCALSSVSFLPQAEDVLSRLGWRKCRPSAVAKITGVPLDRWDYGQQEGWRVVSCWRRRHPADGAWEVALLLAKEEER